MFTTYGQPSNTQTDPETMERQRLYLEEQKRKKDEKKAKRRAAEKAQRKLVTDQGYLTLGGLKNKHGIHTPMYQSMRNKEGNLDPRLQEQLAQESQALSDKYSVEGDTRWADLQKQALAGEFAGARSDAAIQADTASTQALQNLAMRGGARGGASERMAMGGQLARMRNLQGLGAEERGAGLKVSLADEEMKNQALMNIGQQRQGTMQRNIGTLSTDIANQNQFMSQKYKDDMAAYGARKQAKAQKSSGGK